MEKEKLNNIVQNVNDKSNKDLLEARDFLFTEFENTKLLIVDLTKHLESVEEHYNIINKEIGKRIV